MSDGISEGMKETREKEFLSHEAAVKQLEKATHKMVVKLQDGGSRKTYETGAQKEVQDPEKGRFDLIPPGPIFALAKIYAHGAAKYADRNWQKGINISRLLDSAKRHLTQFELGMEDEHHLYQFAWNAIALIYTMDAIRDGLLPEQLLDIPCYMPKTADNEKEWRKENRIVDGYLQEKRVDKDE